MATINVYIPESLKSEMDQTESVNWSGVCQTAIKEELTRLKAIQGDVAAIVTRIRGKGSSMYDQGYEAGKEFAKGFADIDDLEAWQKYPEFRNEDDAPASLLKSVCEASGVDNPEYYSGDVRPNLRWLDGFSKGMDEVYQSVRDELRDL